ncbi:MAG: metal ABC transporter ATP-binding protein [Anaerolineae bacterium]
MQERELEAAKSPGSAQPAIITVRGLTVAYAAGRALADLDLDVRAGERMAIIGPNGAGKSTLLKAIMGLLSVSSGTIDVVGGRERLGYVAQHDEVDWRFPITVHDAVMMGRARQIGWFRMPGKRDRDQVDQALERVDMVRFANRQIGELSGGQRRRVFIARALAQNDDVLLLDEPFSGVDPSAEAELLDTLDKLNAEGLTVVLSTHDLDLAYHRFDRVLALRKRLVALGTPEEVFVPDVLAELYGRGLIAQRDGQHLDLFVDEHGCCDE